MKSMRWVMMAALILAGFAALGNAGDGTRMTVVSCNPIASDLARQVGGDDIALVELMSPGQDPHRFEPTPETLRAASEARVALAMGKGLETWLDDFRDGLPPTCNVVEIGRTIPSLQPHKEQTLYACCPAHAHGALDPHWWHSPRAVRRAVRAVAQAFADADPAHAETYHARVRVYGERLEALEDWARTRLAGIPPERRKLTTAHMAFNYFCEDFGFEPRPIKGLSTKEHAQPEALARLIQTLREERVIAIFPERTENPKLLNEIARQTGVRVGRPLLAGSPDPEDPTYEAMFRYNVEAIADALAAEDR